MGIVEHRPQARRHPRCAAPRHHQAASPGANANVAGNSKDKVSAANGKWRSCGSASNSTGEFVGRSFWLTKAATEFFDCVYNRGRSADSLAPAQRRADGIGRFRIRVQFASYLLEQSYDLLLVPDGHSITTVWRTDGAVDVGLSAAINARQVRSTRYHRLRPFLFLKASIQRLA